ncbi:hypothetical protein [uncultured Erythrobacter sp.]|uniref:GFA family protein n=1 Tax=uncultured Erythrobacter sp. TaxID=263913 RepID=UPI0026116C03|nr:hypothetical protein [uncultured Erythrobacter sp.]
MSHTHLGSCHCGTIQLAFATQLELTEISPRQCGCDFCLKHPANWFADPKGTLRLTSATTPLRYRFGTKTADFVLCPDCGVLVAATCTIDGAAYGIVNLNCLDGRTDWPEPDALSDFDGEGTGDRLARRTRNWMPVETEMPS